METISKNANIGYTLGIIGGILGIACLAIYFKPEETAIVDMGVYMLISAMFFALAGGLTKFGQWSWNLLLLMSFITIGIICVAYVLEIVVLPVAIVFVILAALIVVILSLPPTKSWVNRMKL